MMMMNLKAKLSIPHSIPDHAARLTDPLILLSVAAIVRSLVRIGRSIRTFISPSPASPPAFLRMRSSRDECRGRGYGIFRSKGEGVGREELFCIERGGFHVLRERWWICAELKWSRWRLTIFCAEWGGAGRGIDVHSFVMSSFNQQLESASNLPTFPVNRLTLPSPFSVVLSEAVAGEGGSREDSRGLPFELHRRDFAASLIFSLGRAESGVWRRGRGRESPHNEFWREEKVRLRFRGFVLDGDCERERERE